MKLSFRLSLRSSGQKSQLRTRGQNPISCTTTKQWAWQCNQPYDVTMKYTRPQRAHVLVHRTKQMRHAWAIRLMQVNHVQVHCHSTKATACHAWCHELTTVTTSTTISCQEPLSLACNNNLYAVNSNFISINLTILMNTVSICSR